MIPNTVCINKQCLQGYQGFTLKTLHRTLHYLAGNGALLARMSATFYGIAMPSNFGVDLSIAGWYNTVMKSAIIITDDEYQAICEKQNCVIETHHNANRLKSSQGRREKHRNADKKYMQRLTDQMNGMRW